MDLGMREAVGIKRIVCNPPLWKPVLAAIEGSVSGAEIWTMRSRLDQCHSEFRRVVRIELANCHEEVS